MKCEIAICDTPEALWVFGNVVRRLVAVDRSARFREQRSPGATKGVTIDVFGALGYSAQPWASAHRGRWGQLTPWKNGWKIKKRKHAKKSSFLNILRAIRAGKCRERSYADHIFIQIYFRMHHFVVKFSKFSSPQAESGHWPPNQNPADPLSSAHVNLWRCRADRLPLRERSIRLRAARV